MDKRIKAKLIIDARPNEETLSEISLVTGASAGQQAGFVVFELDYQGKTLYCSWSGGEVSEEGVSLTLIGRAAMEALSNLPMGRNDLVIQGMGLGPTPLIDKIRALLDKVHDGAKVCFVGDLSGELDGQIQHIFNPVGIKQVRH